MITSHKKQNLRHGDKHFETNSQSEVDFLIVRVLQLATSPEVTVSCYI